MWSKQHTKPVDPNELVKLYRSALDKGLAVEEVEAKVSKLLKRTVVATEVEEKEHQEREKEIKHRLPWLMRFFSTVLPVGFIGVGVFLVGSAVIPIASYYVVTAPSLDNTTMAAPIPQTQVLDLVPTVVAERDDEAGSKIVAEPIILDTQLDYTNLSNWFQTTEVPQAQAATTYLIDIPEVDVEGAEVKIGGTDLDKSLIQYPGTADPGELGAPVIFGHSVLRQFYNPDEDNPRRYNSIFSYIMTLEAGDDIFVTHEGVKYQYKVRSKTEVKPEDTYILAQRNDSRLLKLVTCTPEGTYLRRGVVTAELVN